MYQLKFVFIGLLISSLSSIAQASEAYIGQFLYKYKGGNTYRVTVNDNKTMQWACVEGSEKGANGEEKPQRFKLADKVYFATWVEKTGINVSQAIDLKNMKVYSTIDGKERYVLEGNIVREK
ncbi:phenolic acid decarboxylase [Methylotenera sp. L2L1]|uniref:phenolic acid decarboxylase n=1 Tax=Methylotenera sp. L2L1 TaxID=1502770 RepID=UPI00056A6B9E|nr:phenolic acid decarboxylase [Methylotenera sp. L2L1]